METPPPYGAPAAAATKELLTPERLASIRAQSDEPRSRNPFVTDYGVAADVVEELLDHIEAAAAGHHAREASLKSELAEQEKQEKEKLALIQELQGFKNQTAAELQKLVLPLNLGFWSNNTVGQTRIEERRYYHGFIAKAATSLGLPLPTTEDRPADETN